jgi:hypothetical protein
VNYFSSLTKAIVQSRVGNNFWQADPNFRVQFLIFCQRSFCLFHRGHLSLTFVQIFFTKFCKENDSLMNWNEIKGFFMSHLS